MIDILNANQNLAAIDTLLNRSQFDFSDVNDTVDSIVRDVKENGNTALLKYTHTFDSARVTQFKVSASDIEAAFERIDDSLKADLEKAAYNIRTFHENQAPKTRTIQEDTAITLRELVRPIEKVGLYIPGGTAAYPSTVLMNAIPAVVAGVKRIVMVTPPMKDGKVKDSLLVAARIAGVEEIYTIGGAQAIAALTFGTESIPKVDKIVGPGNIYVAMAKRMVSGYVGIDMVAGPSEILILADETTNPEYAAADMLSQAEHDPFASSIVLTTSQKSAELIKAAALRQTTTSKRRGIIEESLTKNGAIIICENRAQMVDLANKIAPEHLELLIQDPESVIETIVNAGAIFVGPYTPEPVGDYFAGPNHTLPTSGSARFSSALSSRDFVKVTTLTRYSKEALKASGNSIINIANEEGLTAHANAVKLRMEE